MMDFIDLEGASGARYRFRVWPEGAPHQPMPGHYAVVRTGARELTVLLVGESVDLSTVRSELPKTDRSGATRIFTRLNVPKVIREAEHEDLAARYQTDVARKAA